VYHHLIASGHKISKWELGYRYKEGKRTLCEVDGLLWTDGGGVVVVEAKQHATFSSLQQLGNTCRIVQEKEGAPVMAFIGSPCFEQAVREEALSRGFGVAELSGYRYRVVEATQSNREGTG
jgi:hypothetical protein